jgi:hypothetical protein
MGNNRAGMKFISHDDRWCSLGCRFRSQERIPGQTRLGRPALLEQKVDERLSLASLFLTEAGNLILERTHVQPRFSCTSFCTCSGIKPTLPERGINKYDYLEFLVWMTLKKTVLNVIFR